MGGDKYDNARIYTQLSREWAMSDDCSLLSSARTCFVVTLQFGFHRYPGSISANDFLQDTGVLESRCGAFLHPVLEHYTNGKLVDEYHLFETLDIRFNTQYKPGESGSTLNQMLLAELFHLHANLSWDGDTTSHEVDSQNGTIECEKSNLKTARFGLARMVASSTPIEEKQELFRKVSQHFVIIMLNVSDCK